MSAGDAWIVQRVVKIPMVGYAVAATHAATGQGTLAMRAALSCTDSTATALGVVAGTVGTSVNVMGALTCGVVGIFFSLSLLTGGVVVSMKTIGVATRAVVGTIKLMRKGISAFIGMGRSDADCEVNET